MAGPWDRMLCLPSQNGEAQVIVNIGKEIVEFSIYEPKRAHLVSTVVVSVSDWERLLYFARIP